METIKTVVQVFTPFIFLASAVIAYKALQANVRINRKNKRADAIIHCNTRYDDIYKYKLHILDSASEKEIHAYYARYWGLKSDEFDYWLANLVDIETLSNWLFVTVQSFRENKPLGTGAAEMRFVDGWKRIGRPDNEATNSWFVDLVDALHKLAIRRDDMHKSKFDALLDLLEQLDRKTARFRVSLEGDLSFKEYRENLKNPKINNIRLLDLV